MAAKSRTEATPGAMLKIQYYRSAIGTPGKHKLVIKSLGFKRLNQVVTRVDTPAGPRHGGAGASSGEDSGFQIGDTTWR